MSRLLTITLAIVVALAGLVVTPDSTLASKKKKDPPAGEPPTSQFSCLYRSESDLVSLLVDTVPGDPDEGFSLVVANAQYMAPKLYRSFPSSSIPRSWVAVEANRDIEEVELTGNTISGKLTVTLDPISGLGSFNFIDRTNGIGVTLTSVKFVCS